MFCIKLSMFLLVDGCLFVGVEPCLRQSVWVVDSAMVSVSPPNAIEWVADPQVVCRFPPLLRLSGSGTDCHALPWLGRRPCNSVRWLVGGPSYLALLGGSRTCKCSEGEARQGKALFARIGQRSKYGVYLLSSGLSVAVKLFTKLFPTFFITLST